MLALVGFGAAASEGGHLLSYQLQYGSAALAVQSQGAHAYFPALAKTSFGLAAVVMLALLLIIGASRLVALRPGTEITPGPSYFSLLAGLFTIQITCFVMQETIESVVAGTAVASAPHLVLLGSIGQLPVAAVAALVLKWLCVRFEAALITLRSAAIAVEIWAHETLAVLVARRAPSAHLALAEVCPTAFVKRGPPQVLCS